MNSNKSVPSSKSVTTQDSAGGVTSGTSVGEQKHKVTINSSIKIIDDEPINVFQEMCENERQDRQEKGKIATALEIANKDRPTKHAITN